MKRTLLLILLLGGFALAQTPKHSATLNWSASPDAGTFAGLSYNVYRADGACPSSGALTSPVKIGNTAALTYADTAVTAGATYCYTVRAVTTAGVESADSAYSGGTVPLAPASGLTVTVQ